MPRVKDSISPPGGWHFPQPLSGGRVLRVKAHGFEPLVAAVLLARLENDITPGDVRQEVEDYVCGLSKAQCVRPELNKPKAAPAPRPPGMKERWVDVILAWANRVTRSRTGMGGITSLPVAQERAQQCARCPLNQRWQNSCPQCVVKTQQVLNRLHQGTRLTKTEITNRIGGCTHHRWDNETAAWHAEPESGKQTEVNPVPGCWAERIRKE